MIKTVSKHKGDNNYEIYKNINDNRYSGSFRDAFRLRR